MVIALFLRQLGSDGYSCWINLLITPLSVRPICGNWILLSCLTLFHCCVSSVPADESFSPCVSYPARFTPSVWPSFHTDGVNCVRLDDLRLHFCSRFTASEQFVAISVNSHDPSVLQPQIFHRSNMPLLRPSGAKDSAYISVLILVETKQACKCSSAESSCRCIDLNICNSWTNLSCCALTLNPWIGSSI